MTVQALLIAIHFSYYIEAFLDLAACLPEATQAIQNQNMVGDILIFI